MLTELAGRSPIDYERRREAEAERLGIRISTLDKEVDLRRPRKEAAVAQGRAQEGHVIPRGKRDTPFEFSLRGLFARFLFDRSGLDRYRIHRDVDATIESIVRIVRYADRIVFTEDFQRDPCFRYTRRDECG